MFEVGGRERRQVSFFTQKNSGSPKNEILEWREQRNQVSDKPSDAFCTADIDVWYSPRLKVVSYLHKLLYKDNIY